MPSVDYAVLRRPRLRGGIGGNTAVMLWSATGVIVLIVGLPWGFLAAIPAFLLQGILLWVYRSDHKIVEIYALYATLPDEFHAGIPKANAVANSRPDKFAKGIRT